MAEEFVKRYDHRGFQQSLESYKLAVAYFDSEQVAVRNAARGTTK